MRAELFPFQREDVEYLKDQPSVLNANDMGTGKTFEAIELDRYHREQLNPDGQTLVVTTSAAIPQWVRFYLQQCDDLTVGRGLHLGANVAVIHWAMVAPELDRLRKIKWQHIIADEAHKIKGRKTARTKALKKLKADRKTALTGTPLVNSPDELWSLLHWLYPRVYTSYWKFFEKHVAYVPITLKSGRTVKKVLGPSMPALLQEEIAPFYVRRMKEDVLEDLPEKYYSTREVKLVGTQRRQYDEMRDDMLTWVEDEPIHAPVVIAQLVRLQQFALGTYDGTRLRKPSAKLDDLLEILDSTDQQIVVFTMSSSFVDLAMEHVGDAVALTGKIKGRRREDNLARFQAGKVRVLFATIKTGGEAIDLTNASTCVFVDRSWSPAENSQAEDRLHRMGQKSSVHVIDIVAEDTTDQGKEQKLELKREWIRSILE